MIKLWHYDVGFRRIRISDIGYKCKSKKCGGKCTVMCATMDLSEMTIFYRMIPRWGHCHRAWAWGRSTRSASWNRTPGHRCPPWCRFGTPDARTPGDSEGNPTHALHQKLEEYLRISTPFSAGIFEPENFGRRGPLTSSQNRICRI